MTENVKKYYWLRLQNTFFNNREIKKLRKGSSAGDTLTVIYLKLQLLSISTEGLLVFEGTEDTFIEQIAMELDEKVTDVKLLLGYMVKNKLIEQLSETEYLLPKVVPLIGKETAAAERMRRLRDRKTIPALNTKNQPSRSTITGEGEEDEE
jgi:predicted phage replisome organizer